MGNVSLTGDKPLSTGTKRPGASGYTPGSPEDIQGRWVQGREESASVLVGAEVGTELQGKLSRGAVAWQGQEGQE